MVVDTVKTVPLLHYAAKPSGSEFVNIGSLEENLLETYFVLLSKFSFDRAKEQCVSGDYFHPVLDDIRVMYLS